MLNFHSIKRWLDLPGLKLAMSSLVFVALLGCYGQQLSSVCVYSEDDYEGDSWCLPHSLNLDVDNKTVFFIGRISSVKIHGFIDDLILYSESHFQGDSLRIGESITSLSELGFDNRAKSVVIVSKGKEPSRKRDGIQKTYITSVNEPVEFKFSDMIGPIADDIGKWRWKFHDETELFDVLDPVKTYTLPGFYSYIFSWGFANSSSTDGLGAGFVGTVAVSAPVSSECPHPIYQKGADYQEGDIVQLGAAEFKCLSSEVCSQPYEVGVPEGDGYWGPIGRDNGLSAWEFIGLCPVKQREYEPRSE